MRLPIIRIVGEAFSQLTSRWRTLSRALIGPATALAALEIAIDRVGSGDLSRTIALSIPDFLIYVLYAVSCHRIVLLGPQSLANPWGVYWSARELRFVGWSVAVGLLAFLPVLPLLAVMFWLAKLASLDLLTWLDDFPTWVPSAIAWIVYAPAAYVASRASLVLPATAIGQRPTLANSWALSRQNGWRLTIALSIPGLIVAALSQLAWSALGKPDGIVPGFLLGLWFCLLGAVEVTVLSVTFRRLSSLELDGAAA